MERKQRPAFLSITPHATRAAVRQLCRVLLRVGLVPRRAVITRGCRQGYAINPAAIYFVEGCGQGNIHANWGDGFSTAANVITPGGGSDPTRFFKTLLSKKYRCAPRRPTSPPTVSLYPVQTSRHLGRLRRRTIHYWPQWSYLLAKPALARCSGAGEGQPGMGHHRRQIRPVLCCTAAWDQEGRLWLVGLRRPAANDWPARQIAPLHAVFLPVPCSESCGDCQSLGSVNCLSGPAWSVRLCISLRHLIRHMQLAGGAVQGQCGDIAPHLPPHHHLLHRSSVRR